MQPADVAQRIYETLGADEVPGFLALCAPDVTVAYPAAGLLPYGGQWSGREGAERFLDAHESAEDILDLAIDRFVTADDTVVALGRFRGRARSTGREWATPFVHVLTIRDGRLERWEAFFDTALAVAAHRADRPVV